MRYTKIVATIGPASDAPAVLDRLVSVVDVARLNASHGTFAELDARLRAVRESSARVGRDVAVMLDLSGPKLRVGRMQDGVALTAGDPFELQTVDCVGDVAHACVTYTGLSDDLSPGDTVLLDDGRVQLRVRETAPGVVRTEVEVGGPLASNKGVNVPGVTLAVDAITEKDRRDLEWALEAGVDLIALSFVRSAYDIGRLRQLMGGRPVPVVAKVEKHEAVERMQPIVEAADVIMVARGDLGVETSPEAVPVIQRRLIQSCREAGKPVVVATQMLESMISAPRPTRAEASDVATAIFEGADAVMLSGETAIGEYPVEAAEVMDRIAITAEASEDFCFEQVRAQPSDGVTEAVSAAVCELANDLRVAAVVSSTQSGATARAVARHRPNAPIVAVTPVPEVARQLMIVWGVVPRVVRPPTSIEDMIALAIAAARDAGAARSGDMVAITAGVALNQPGTTDLIQVRPVP